MPKSKSRFLKKLAAKFRSKTKGTVIKMWYESKRD